MRILEIEQAFKNEKELKKVLDLCKEDIELVDYYANDVLKSKLANNAEEAKSAVLVLAGVYSNLTTVLSIAITEKKNRETREYNRIRIEAENAEKKVTDSAKEMMASEYVADYRWIRNVIEGYVTGCEKQISALQTTLKNEKRNYNAQD
jgi:cell division septum initiation protein DivIVA